MRIFTERTDCICITHRYLTSGREAKGGENAMDIQWFTASVVCLTVFHAVASAGTYPPLPFLFVEGNHYDIGRQIVSA